MSESALVGLAILKTNWDEREQSPLHGFVPFVAHCMRAAESDTLSVSDLQGCVIEEFGITIPQHVLQTILRRCVREGLAKRERGLYVRNESALSTSDLSEDRSAALRELGALVSSFQRYSQTEYEVTLTDDQAEDTLLAFVEERSVPILRAMLSGKPYDTSAIDEADSASYLVASFVQHLFERDPQGFSYLERLVKGSMLAAVMYFPDTGRFQKRFHRLQVFLDTPFLLDALGFRGQLQEQAAKEVLDLLYELGAELATFDVTVEELRGVLRASASSLSGRRPPPDVPSSIDLEFLRRGLRSSDVELIAHNLESRLSAARVRVEEARPFSDQRFDPEALKKAIQAKVGYVRTETLEHDAICLEAVVGLRRGRPQHELEEARAIFITTNVHLVQGAMNYFSKRMGAVPVAMLVHELATLAWLKKPLSAPDLPRKRILADCYAALEPDTRLWRKYLDETERLRETGDVSEDDYYILRYGLEARALLMKETKGRPDNLSASTIREVLERTKQHLRSDLEETVSNLKSDLEATRSEATVSRLSAQGVIEAQRVRATSIANRLARIVVRAVFGLAAALIAALLLFSGVLKGIPVLDVLSRDPWRGIAVTAVGILAYLNLVWGVTLSGLARVAETRLASMIEPRLERLMVPDGSELRARTDVSAVDRAGS